MARYGKETKHDPARVVQEAVEFFGPEGLGLQVTDESENRVSFDEGRNTISVDVCKKDANWEVNVETQEWDDRVKQFLSKI